MAYWRGEGGGAVGEGSFSVFAEVTSRHQLDFNDRIPDFLLAQWIAVPIIHIVTTAADQLHREMLDMFGEVGRGTEYWGRRFDQAVNRNGGLATAKRMLAKRLKNPNEQQSDGSSDDGGGFEEEYGDHMTDHLPREDQHFDGDGRLNRMRSLEPLRINSNLEFEYEYD